MYIYMYCVHLKLKFSMTSAMISYSIFNRSDRRISAVMTQMHFSVQPVSKLGNLIASVLQQWECVDHLCGLDQVVIQIEGIFSVYMFIYCIIKKKEKISIHFISIIYMYIELF